MRPNRVAHAAAGTLFAASLVLWGATGREGYTRWPDARLEAADRPSNDPATDMLREAGLGEAPPTSAALRSRFALGLVPGGLDLKHVASVSTALVAAALISGIGAMLHRVHKPAQGVRK